MSHQVTSPTPPVTEMGSARPILRVARLDESVRYYVDVLGFALRWRAGSVAEVRRGEAALMLCEGDQGQPGTWLWIAVGDADALHDELRARDARIRVPPTNYPWGSREVHVTDPDGHVLRFGSDLREGEAMGAWIDGAGVRWLPLPEGGWRRE